MEFYCNKTWDEYFKQINIIPSLTFTSSSYDEIDHFEMYKHRVTTYVISMNFIIWDFGLTYTSS